jgi:endonuclease/exonuclease/phosphatase family metal-dependent hydrolase
MKCFLFVLFFSLLCADAHAEKILNLNVFDELQGSWEPGFRAKRMQAVADYVQEENPDLIVFQEAKGILPGEKKGGEDSIDGELFHKKYPHRKYIHEMTGKDGSSYGYWIGAKKKPNEWIEDGFAFPGGVERKVQAAIWGKGSSCLGVLSLHWSYQSSDVRQKEANWLLDWLKRKEKKCASWLVVGDFNADKEDPEMRILFDAGLNILIKEIKPTIGAFNPIRRIYGENIPSRTIDWALGWNLSGSAQIVLDTEQKNAVWVSDHAAVLVQLEKAKK